MSDAHGRFLTGVIEGFYGRCWTFENRRAYARHLPRLGLNSCLYCPKSDPYLRRRWQEHWPARQWQQLQQLAAEYRNQGVFWGVGLSPYALYLDYGARERKKLREKLARLAELEAPLLAILFDDMPGDMDGLAQRQGEIIQDVVHWIPQVRLQVCPTYYSFDPVLEKYFGRMPSDYWRQFGAAVPPGVDIFWTGNRVCSDSVTERDVACISSELGRPVLLWDNYPVNDGAQRSDHLYCTALSRRERIGARYLSGHLCNAMNQALLSLPALTGLAALYRGDGCDDWLQQELGGATWERLQRDRHDFEQLGLSGMGPDRCRELEREYRALPGGAAREVADWLAGQYTFDPACLTD